MRYQFIKNEQCNHSVRRMCQVLGVSHSGYYAWVNREESLRSKRNQLLIKKIVSIHDECEKRYGSPRVHAELKSQGKGFATIRVAPIDLSVLERGGTISPPRMKAILKVLGMDVDYV